MRLLFIVLLFLNLKLYSQEIPQLDTLTLKNGLKIYLLPYGEDSILSVRLVINGGQGNETACQVGYSELIRQLFKETFIKKQNSAQLESQTNHGQTILSGACINKNLDEEAELLSTALLKLSFRKDQIDQAVSSIIDSYKSENMDPYRLAYVFKNLLLYGPKKPLGRNYCQYQLEKVLPGELKEFYLKYYIPKGSSLFICGNFNTTEAKKIITKRFNKWKSTDKVENPVDNEVLKMKNKEIVLINKDNSGSSIVELIQPAPSFKSPDHLAFLIVCDLFHQYLAKTINEASSTIHDSLKFEPVSYTANSLDIMCISQSEVSRTVNLFDTLLHKFHKLKFTQKDLLGVLKKLEENYKGIRTPEAVLSFYDPLVYDFNSRRNYLNSLSTITIQDIQMILKKYFDPGIYKLVVVGKREATSDQLVLSGNGTEYQPSDFETCDEVCKGIGQNKKSMHICFYCLLRVKRHTGHFPIWFGYK